MTEHTEPKQRGGARPGSGPKTADGAKGLVPYSVAVPPELRDRLRELGTAKVRHALYQACKLK